MPKYLIAGPVGYEGAPTGDGRFISDGALRFADRMPLMFVRTSSEGHKGSVVVGHFTGMSRVDDGTILAEGEFIDADGAPKELAEDIRTAMLLVAGGHAPGVSMDLDEVTAELRIAKEMFEDGSEELEEDEEGRVTVAKLSPSDQLMVFTDALVRGATLVSIPAFKNANLAVFDENGVEIDENGLRSAFGGEIEPIEAEIAEFADENVDYDAPDCACALYAAAPREVDARIFTDIDLDAPTALTVEDGVVFGHIALWDTCHTGFPGTCTTPPRDPSGQYSGFHQSRLSTTEGPIRVGVLTVGGGHADPKLGARAAMEHYDNVGTAWAYVKAFEDEFGIAVVGVLADGVNDDTLATALAHPISGDWRNLGGGLELVAACSVNTPGFPVLAASAGTQTSLIASNAPQADEEEILTNPLLTNELAKAIVDEMERRETRRSETLALEAEANEIIEAIAEDLELEAQRLAAEVLG